MKTIELPDDVYRRAQELAELNHVSVDRLVAELVSDGADDWIRLQARAGRGSIEKLQRVLSKVRDAPAEAIDRL
jgi:predicted transcriptional regulator